MLIFFAAWHTGLDLKQAHQSWDESFALFNFKPGHKQIIQNMKVKYKCLNAHDDFSLQRHKNAQAQGIVPMEYSGIFNNLMDEIDMENSFEIDADIEPIAINCIGHKTAK